MTENNNFVGWHTYHHNTMSLRGSSSKHNGQNSAPSSYPVRTIFPEYVLGTYWYVLCLQKYCSQCCFVSYACGKQYYVSVTCVLWCSNTELCPYWCPTYMTLFWYIHSTYQYVLVCTDIDFLYWSVLGTYLFRTGTY